MKPKRADMTKWIVVIVALLMLVSGVMVARDLTGQAMDFYMSGMSEYFSKNYTQAAKLLQRALELDPFIESRASNIKLILGISAFHAGNDILAANMLELFPDNPLAISFMQRIVERQSLIDPQDTRFRHTYLMDMHQAPADPPVTVPDHMAGEPLADNAETRETPIFIFMLIFLIVTTILLLIEFRWQTFSKIAFRLLGANANITLQVKRSTSPGPVSDEPAPATASSENQQLAPAEFLEDPLEEEIDIEELASRRIEDIDRFFETLDGSGVAEKTKEEAISEPEDILAAIEEDAAKGEILDTSRLFDEGDAEQIEAPEYELVEEYPEEFDFNQVLKSLKKMIQESEKAAEEKPPEEDQEFKSIEEVMKEPVVKDLAFFESIDRMDNEELDDFMNMVFDERASDKVV